MNKFTITVIQHKQEQYTMNLKHILLALCFLVSISPSSSQNNANAMPPLQNNASPVPSNPAQVTPNGVNPSSLPRSYTNCFKKVYAFGDSFTDTGNSRLLNSSNYNTALIPGSPYGSNFFDSPTKRYSDGRLVIDFLTDMLKIPHLHVYMNFSANFTFGVNFAVAGTTALPVDLAAKQTPGRKLTFGLLIPLLLQKQIEWFNTFLKDVYGNNQRKWQEEVDGSLVWIGEFGANDYIRSFGKELTASSQSLTETAVNNVCTLLKTVLDKGAKYVVIQGLPPTGCFPFELSTSPQEDRDEKGCSKTANSIILAHNNLLQAKIQQFQKLYPQAIISYADYYSAYYAILANPNLYGFEEPYKACCGSGGNFNFNLKMLCGSPEVTPCPDASKYISWDGVHLTEAMYSKMAELFFTGGFCQPHFTDLIQKKCP